MVDAKLRSNNIQEPLPRDARPLFRVVPAGAALGKPVFSGKLQDKKGGTWDGWFTSRIRDLAPGKYTLQIEATDSLSKQSITRIAEFSVKAPLETKTAANVKPGR